MKGSHFADEQITLALRQAETVSRAAEVCRKLGISEAASYNWKKKYGGPGLVEVRRLKQLEEKNRRLKCMEADLSLDKQMLLVCFQENYNASPQALPGGRSRSGLCDKVCAWHVWCWSSAAPAITIDRSRSITRP